MQTKIIRKAESAYQLLNSVFCVYKPAGTSSHLLHKDIINKLCEDLNSLVVRKPEKIVELQRIRANHETRNKSLAEFQKHEQNIMGIVPDGENHLVKIVKKDNLADHPLITGPRYIAQDISLTDSFRLGNNTSGVQVIGINDGYKLAKRLYQSRWTRTYIVSGKFGIATHNYFHTGKIFEKSTYHRINKHLLEQVMNSFQALHQKTMFQASGLPLYSELAYETASQGMVRPAEDSEPIIYSLKCLQFDPPNFDIEVQAINENESYLMGLVHNFGLKLHSTAVCTQIRCIKYGPFGLDLAMLKKHLSLENTITNISKCSELLKNYNTYLRKPLVNPNEMESPELVTTNRSRNSN